jgi:hypothetical protein
VRDAGIPFPPFKHGEWGKVYHGTILQPPIPSAPFNDPPLNMLNRVTLLRDIHLYKLRLVLTEENGLFPSGKEQSGLPLGNNVFAVGGAERARCLRQAAGLMG